MQGYARIWQDIFWELGYEWRSYPRKNIQSRYPNISFHIHVYPSIQSCKISTFISPKVIQCKSCISSFIQVQYPGKIFLMISNYDILTISKYISICIQYRYLYQISLVLSDLVILQCSFYPCPISRENIHDDVQSWYPGFIR